MDFFSLFCVCVCVLNLLSLIFFLLLLFFICFQFCLVAEKIEKEVGSWKLMLINGL